jgi:hypothetical protein
MNVDICQRRSCASQEKSLVIAGNHYDLKISKSKIPFFATKFLPTIHDGQWKKRYQKFCILHIEKSSLLSTYHRCRLLFRQMTAIPLDLPVD